LKKVYFISGLGADKRVFSFLDLSFCEPVFIDWITPLKNESLRDYALRLRQEIKDEAPFIIGISFGGMLATEMAKADPGVKAIILSSIQVSSELPGYFRTARYLPIYKLLPSSFLKRGALWFRNRLGAKGSAQKKILQQIIKDTNTTFLKWAIGAILSWKNNTRPANLIHIHGTADKLLPWRFVKADHRINNGTHVMPMDDHGEISDLLKKLVETHPFSAIS
jgi:pimeloyl-ACP methyl ester carboxylesterase